MAEKGRITVDARTPGRITIAGHHWNARQFQLHGRTLELYRLNCLATALGRGSQTLFHWERKGWLPKSLYLVKGDRCTRWYSKEQILNLSRLLTVYPFTSGPYSQRKAFIAALRHLFYETQELSEEELRARVKARERTLDDLKHSATVAAGGHPAKSSPPGV